MTRSTITIIITTIIILCNVIQSLGEEEDEKEECLSCYANGESCTYCRGNDFFDNPSVCVCGDLTDGFFGDCSDHTFGGEEWNCSERSAVSTPILVAAVAVSIFFLICCMKRVSKNGGGCGASTTATAAATASSPGFTPTTATAATAATATSAASGVEIPTSALNPPPTAPWFSSDEPAASTPTTGAGGNDSEIYIPVATVVPSSTTGEGRPSTFDTLNAKL